MKLQKSIWYILLLIFGSVLYFLLFTYQNIQRNKESFHWVNHTQEVIKTINAVRSDLFEVESQVRGFVISGNTDFLDHYESRKIKLATEAQKLLNLTSDNQRQLQNGKQLLTFVQQKIDFQNKVYNAAIQSRVQGEDVIATMIGKRLTDSLENILQKMETEERSLLTVRMGKLENLSESRYLTSIVIAAIVLVFLSVLLISIIKENVLRRRAESKAVENETKYRNLIENSAVVVYTTDSIGYYTYLSGKCKDFTGFHAEELVGEHFLLLVETAWEQKVQSFYLAQKENQTKETVFEFPIITKNGERKWIEQSVVLLEENGKPSGFQCVAKDVTERKYGEKLLADAEREIKAKQEEYQARLQSILDNMPMIVYLKDLDGNFMLVNRQFHEVFGTTDKEVIGKKELNVHLDEESASKFMSVDEEVKSTLQHIELEDLLLTKDGERNMSIVKFPLLDKEGNLFAISAVGKDITENIRYQKQLIEARERAEKAERLQEEFLANMSHEIRTPMNGIIGMTDLMETTFLNGEQKEYLRLIKESSQILLALINDILDLSKIKAGRMTVELIDYNLQNTVDAVAAPFCLKAKEKGITIIKKIDQSPQFIIGDQHKLIQILNNLLSNAIKFTEKGSVSLTVNTFSEGGEMQLVCTVTDTGMGIAKENLEYIFQSFVQAGNDMVRRFGGTGLGLAITKRLIELQDGQITVSSEVGKGTTFRFQIPIQKSELTKSVNEVIAPQEEIDAKSLRFKKILLIEDNEVNQKVTFLMLHKAGMFVDIAANGTEAIAFLESGRVYDLIITDLQMPEMDGFQTTQYIRNSLQLQTPIIAMTASALRNEKEKCFELGMNEYLTKPFSPNVLFFHLKKYLLSQDEASQPSEEILVGDTTDLYSLQFLHEMEDIDYTIEVLELFLKTTPPTLEEISAQVQHKNWDEVYRKAHSLKSSLGLLQMNRMLDSVSGIEQLAKTSTNTSKIPSLLNNVLQQYQLVKPMLEAELSLTRKNTVV
ncbi:MAG: PAS domain S-box protein [Chitinophagaceae bacterium]|nr:MAG: PAS domain S-box protein [Chitinophagaceae bacterium]